MKRFWRENNLSLVVFALFLGTLTIGQFLTGLCQYNDERMDRGMGAVSFGEYWLSPHFLEATTENWESEFFQMFIYVFITVFLVQKGSAESNAPTRSTSPETALSARSPWAARQGGWIRSVYSHSLSLAFLVLFGISFIGHAYSGARLFNEEEVSKGNDPIGVLEYIGGSRFWFESFQNWQSEFLAIGAMVVLSIHLREKGSPESKPVNMPHSDQE